MKRALLLLAVLPLLAACGSARGQVLGARVTKLHCPARGRSLFSNVGAHHRYSRLVQPGASEILLCRYAGANAQPPLHLVRSRLIRKHATVSRLTDRLNALPPERGRYCTFDDGSEILLVFGYPDGASARVSVGLRGCDDVSNGRTGTLAVTPAGRRLVDELVRLVHR